MRYFARILSKSLWKSKFAFCFWAQSQKVPGANQRDFWVFPKLKVSDEWHFQRFLGDTVTCKTSGLRWAVTHTIAPY